MKLVTNMLIGLIKAYRLILSPVLPMSCRYLPTCSHYACDALTRHGPLRGGWLTIARILRCHPWGGDGYDPVPERLTPWAGAAFSIRRIAHHREPHCHGSS